MRTAVRVDRQQLDVPSMHWLGQQVLHVQRSSTAMTQLIPSGMLAVVC